MRKKIKIDIGVMTDSFKSQLNEQGYDISKGHESKMEKIKDSIFMLGFHGYINEKEKDKMFQKFMNDLLREVKKLEED